MRRLALGAALLLALAPAPGLAHRLTVFATVTDGAVSGYGFFVGGRRIGGGALRAEDGAGGVLFEGRTDAEGAFAFPAPAAGPVRLILDAGEGHVAEIVLGPERFARRDAGSGNPSLVPVAPGAAAAGIAADDLAALVEAKVEAAVARQIAPLIAAQEAAEARVRFNDVAGGVGMIAGLAGVALWARGRKS